MEYKLRRLDREAVLKALSTGEYEAIATSSHGALDELMHLAVALGGLRSTEVDQDTP
ncbi:MAG TPA: hypothetical protein G4N94_10170 [Caldilineae bacterium]|nr:hypothetical protein [Caldilineae bacterium]